MSEIIVPNIDNNAIPLFFKVIAGIAFITTMYYLRERKYSRFRKSESE